MRFVEANYYTVLWHVHHRGKSSENYSGFIVIRQILFSFLCYYIRGRKNILTRLELAKLFYIVSPTKNHN